MSDGRNERLASTGNDDHQRDSRILSGGNRDGSDTSAPVATSVSALDDLDRVATWLDLPEHQISLPEHKHGNDCGGHTPFTAGSCLRCAVEIAMAAYAREYASSSSAAPLYGQPRSRILAAMKCLNIDEALTKWEAAEAKCAELQGWKESQIACTPDYQEIGKLLGVRLGESVHDKIIPGILALRDSRDRLQEALRESKRDNEFLGEMLKCDPSETLEDGFGSAWSRTCPKCGLGLMQVVRPGSAQCAQCG